MKYFLVFVSLITHHVYTMNSNSEESHSSLRSMISGMQEKVLSKGVIQKLDRAEKKLKEANIRLEATAEWQEMTAKHNTWQNYITRRRELREKGQHDNAIEIECHKLYNDYDGAIIRLCGTLEHVKQCNAN